MNEHLAEFIFKDCGQADGATQFDKVYNFADLVLSREEKLTGRPRDKQ